MNALAAARFVLLRHLPLVVLDVPDGGGPAPGSEPAERDLLEVLEERGLVRLPGFYGIDLPRGIRVGFALTDTELRLEDEAQTGLLRVGRDSIDPTWIDRALAMKGTMLVVGDDLDLDPDLEGRQLTDVLDRHASRGDLLGGIAGVAEPQTGLPLLLR